MSTEKLIGRRELLRRSGVGAALVVGASLGTVGCGGGLDCTDTSGLSAEEVRQRNRLTYVERSTNGNRKCSNCSVFSGGAAGACGTCTLVPGPINPNGYCSSWSAG